MKRKVVLLSGAGASLDFGIPCALQLTQEVEARFRRESSLREAGTTLLDSILACLRRELPRPNEITFEQILEAIEDVAVIGCKGDPSHYTRNESCPLVGCVSRLREELGALGDVYSLYYDYYDAVLNSVIEKLSRVQDSDIACMAAACGCWSDRARLASFTLNYDDLVDRALGNPETGFAPGEQPRRFAASRLNSVWPAGRVLHCHLHGSARWRLRVPREDDVTDDPTELIEQDRPNAPWRSDPSQRYLSIAQSGRFRLIGPVVTGLTKTEGVLVEPFFSYLHAFHRALGSCTELVIAGYAFTDHHINAALRNVFASRGRGQLYIVDCDQSNDPWRVFDRLNNRVEARALQSIWRGTPTALSYEHLDTYPGWCCFAALDARGRRYPPVAMWLRGFKAFCESMCATGLPSPEFLRRLSRKMLHWNLQRED